MIIDTEFLTLDETPLNIKREQNTVQAAPETDDTTQREGATVEEPLVKLEVAEKDDSGSNIYLESPSTDNKGSIFEKIKEIHNWKKNDGLDTETEQPVNSEMSFQPSGKHMSDLSKSDDGHQVFNRTSCK